ncbi:conjugal transfer protein TraE [Vibrio halioticoli NBRC 102217]|uniref:Conjugal transfer protein TraE n=1 Tax=Vibrio halioticoli NBRC 102217 TaxID=1219072 RepID=V5F422_9VIBR|nr:conjugal transfer protein TraE [Vibrio halioticoli]GAD89954.1 conjugal transfer protein TraE [Vibrio halioticoli NBRC 102217]
MEFSRLKTDFKLLKESNKLLVVANVVLVLVLCVSLFFNTQKDTIVIHNLNEHCVESELSRTNMSEDNHKRLGFYIANMLGNITPNSSEYTIKSVMPFVGPRIYKDVRDSISTQLGELVNERVVMSFSPERALYENGTVFITGRGQMVGPTGKTDRFSRTYEMQFSVENYTPLLHYINVYEGGPRDSEWTAKQKKKEQK